MGETEARLLERGVVVLPEYIGHDVYVQLLDVLLALEGREVRLYCRGDGGGSRYALAMVDLIAQHGNVIGLLVGEANSSHGIVWAGCQRRYFSPHGSLGVHKVAFTDFPHMDSQYARSLAWEYEQAERMNADILAKASNQSAAFWYDMMQQAGSYGLCHVGEALLLAYEMARPIAELT